MTHTYVHHVPAGAIDYCKWLQNNYPFHFKLAGDRQSKAGDYRYDPRSKSHTITVNRTLNQYAFLITFVHEVAHHAAYSEFGRRVSPHGVEWKRTFKKLMAPLLNPEVFPNTLLQVLAKHMISPKASTHADGHLVKALLAFDIEKALLLEDIEEGSCFTFRGKQYIKHETRRSRVVCSPLNSSRRYLISRMAQVGT